MQAPQKDDTIIGERGISPLTVPGKSYARTNRMLADDLLYTTERSEAFPNISSDNLTTNWYMQASNCGRRREKNQYWRVSPVR